MKFFDRLLTIVVTATLTSAVWIVAGGSLIENATADSQRSTTRPAEVAPSPTGTATAAGVASEAEIVPSLDSAEAAAPKETGNVPLQIPVLNVRPTDLTDTFSDSQRGGKRLHEALDIMAPVGTSVVAAAPGTVEKMFSSDVGGNTVYVRSTDGKTIYYYAHMDGYAEGLKEGQRVRRGQRLGSVGSSGTASEEAPHLHFAILQTTPEAAWWEPATATNPYSLLRKE